MEGQIVPKYESTSNSTIKEIAVTLAQALPLNLGQFEYDYIQKNKSQLHHQIQVLMSQLPYQRQIETLVNYYSAEFNNSLADEVRRIIGKSVMPKKPSNFEYLFLDASMSEDFYLYDMIGRLYLFGIEKIVVNKKYEFTNYFNIDKKSDFGEFFSKFYKRNTLPKRERSKLCWVAGKPFTEKVHLRVCELITNPQIFMTIEMYLNLVLYYLYLINKGIVQNCGAKNFLSQWLNMSSKVVCLHSVSKSDKFVVVQINNVAKTIYFDEATFFHASELNDKAAFMKDTTEWELCTKTIVY